MDQFTYAARSSWAHVWKVTIDINIIRAFRDPFERWAPVIFSRSFGKIKEEFIQARVGVEGLIERHLYWITAISRPVSEKLNNSFIYLFHVRCRATIISRQMRSWFVFLALLSLANYGSGRTIFHMIEFDEGLEVTRAYKKCIADCKRRCKDVDCADDATMGNLCMNGGLTENGFRVQGCSRFFPQKRDHDIPVKPKVLVKPKEIWQLFQK